MQPALNALPLADGSILLVGLTCSGDARALLLHAETAQASHWSALGGKFTGRIAALAINGGAELFAVTPRGAVEYTTWHSGEKSSGHWHPLGEDHVYDIFASADHEDNCLFALTPEREVLSMLRGHFIGRVVAAERESRHPNQVTRVDSLECEISCKVWHSFSVIPPIIGSVIFP